MRRHRLPRQPAAVPDAARTRIQSVFGTDEPARDILKPVRDTVDFLHKGFYLAFFAGCVFLSGMSLSILITMLYESRPEYQGPARAGLALLPGAALMFSVLPAWAEYSGRCGPALRVLRIGYTACGGAFLAWALAVHALQRAPYADYFLCVALALLLEAELLIAVSRLLLDLLNSKDRLRVLAGAAYLGMLYPVAGFVIAIAFCPLGPMILSPRLGYWTLVPCARAGINAQGLRGPAVPAAKAPDVRRIAVVGDSSAFGLWLRYEDTFASRLRMDLNSTPPWPGKRYEVVNAGVPTQRVESVRLRYFTLVAPLKPDILIVYAGHNDAREDPRFFRARVMTMVEEMRARGGRVILCTYPHLHNAAGMDNLARAVRLMAAEENLTLVDLDGVILNHRRRYFFANGTHPTKAGHRRIAAALFQAVADVEMQEQKNQGASR